MSASEIDFLLHIAQFQDETALVCGIDYQSICKSLNISVSNYYKIINSLVAKRFITAMPDYNNWSFRILNNTALETQSHYLNLNIEFLHTENFINLKRNEKIIVLNLIKLTGFKQKEMCVTFEKLKEWTGAKLQVIRHYVKHLANLFKGYFRVERMKIFFGSLSDPSVFQDLFKRRPIQEKLVEKKQNLIFWNKKYKLNPTIEAIEDTAKLFLQYGNSIPDGVDKDNFILQQVLDCIKNKGEMIPAYINTLISSKIKELLNQKTSKKEPVPSGYESMFIPYSYCYNKEKLEQKLNSIFEKISDEPLNKILEITKNNLMFMLNSTEKLLKIKGSNISFRQVFDLIVSIAGSQKPDADPEEKFARFIHEYAEDVARNLSKVQINDNPEGYLRSWLYDSMTRKAAQAFLSESAASVAAPPEQTTKPMKKNKFQNFEGSDYDFDKLKEMEEAYIENKLHNQNN